MSSAGKKSSAYHGTSRDSKPRYVKKLNFGRRLETNLKICQPPKIVAETSAKNFFTLDKESFVNDWLRKHENVFFEENNVIYPTSPILSSSITKRIPGSPNLGNSRKRPRREYSPRDNSSRKENLLDVDRLKRKNESLSSSILSNHTQQSDSRVQGKSQEKNLQQPLCLPESPSSSCVNKSPVLTGKVGSRRFQQSGSRMQGKSQQENLQSGSRVQGKSLEENLCQPLFIPGSPSSSCVNKSPVLTGKVRSRKFRRKRLSEGKNKTNSSKLEESFKLENNVESEKSIKVEGNLIPSVSMIVTIPDKKSNSSQIEDETIFEEEEVEEMGEEDLFESQRIDSCEETQCNNYKSRREMSPTFITEIETESSLKGSLLIETKSSKGVRDNQSTFIDDETDTEKTTDDFIEDADTSDVVFVNNVKDVPMIVKEKVPDICKSPSKASDETFFSRAGSCRSQVVQLSQEISQISSLKLKSSSLSQINNVISTETLSPKPVVEPFINILKTEKKKRKGKKGSLVAKLQTLVSREISFMRMWQHQISQPTFQNVNVQFVDLCILQNYNSYNRQFTECRLIADTYNLLRNILKLETEQGVDSQSVNSKRPINRTITIMTIPEVVGWIKAKKGNRLKVYLPWEILDQENLTLSVMYFTVDEKVNFEINDEESVQNKRIEKFDCPCIQKGKVVEDCSFKFGSRKPNVIEEIFNIS